MAALDRLGREINVRNGDGYQFSSATTALSGGRLLITWTEDSGQGEYSRDLYGRIYAADGTPGRVFIVNRAANEQIEPDLAATADGGFVATWRTQTNPLGSERQFDVVAQRFDAAGNPIGGQIAVHADTRGAQGNPSIAELADQRFVVSWDDFGGSDPDPSGGGVKQQLFAADGTAIGAATRVNVSTQGNQGGTAVVSLADGGYAVTWYSAPSSSSGANAAATVFVRFYDAAGAARGGEIAISQGVALAIDPVIAALTDGTLAVAFSSYNPALGTSEVFVRRIDADGQPIGAVQQVNTVSAGLQIGQSILALDGGGYLVGWTDFSGSYGDDQRSSSKLQVFDAQDRPVGDAILANTTIVGDQAGPQAVQLSDGRLAVSWNDIGEPVDGYSEGDIRLQYFTVAPPPQVLTGRSRDDRLDAADGRDWLLDGLAGNDRLRGAAGDDTLRGGAGDDILSGGGGDDRIEIGQGAGFDRIDGGTGYDVLRVVADDATIGVTTVANIERIDASGRTGATIRGDDARNVIDLRGIEVLSIGAIDGGGGNDTIHGSSNDDVIAGGAGRDSLSGGDGTDRFIGTKDELRGDTILDFGFGDQLFISDFNGSSDHSTIAIRGDRVFFDPDGADGVEVPVVITFGLPIASFSVLIDGSGALTFSVL